MGERAGTVRAAQPHRKNAFTLVELMVVIAVIGIAAAAAVWAMPDPRGRLVDEGARLATRVRAAHAAAIIGARPVSVWVDPAGYGFDAWEGGQWRALAEKPLRVERWNDGTAATIAGRQRVTFDATGLADRSLSVPLIRERARVTVTIAGDGQVRVDG